MAEIWVIVEEHGFRVPHGMIDSICFRGENELGLLGNPQHALVPPVLDSCGRHREVLKWSVVQLVVATAGNSATLCGMMR